ncbi:MAG: hypothetical protein IPL39_19890 [Opitutaceae bacterium]|nr:hypothetical protein [Opitutaceae bacterium]
MPATLETARLLDRIASLEARLAALERHVGVEPAESDEAIPWTVIVAAVAAVVREPFAIRHVELAPTTEVNWWGLEGRVRHFASRPRR